MAEVSSFRMGVRPGLRERPPRAHRAPTRLPQLLFQESNPGVRYEYIIHREAGGHDHIQPPEFSWRYGPWSKCTVTCGTGEGVGRAAARRGLCLWAVRPGFSL